MFFYLNPQTGLLSRFYDPKSIKCAEKDYFTSREDFRDKLFSKICVKFIKPVFGRKFMDKDRVNIVVFYQPLEEWPKECYKEEGQKFSDAMCYKLSQMLRTLYLRLNRDDSITEGQLLRIKVLFLDYFEEFPTSLHTCRFWPTTAEVDSLKELNLELLDNATSLICDWNHKDAFLWLTKLLHANNSLETIIMRDANCVDVAYVESFIEAVKSSRSVRKLMVQGSFYTQERLDLFGSLLLANKIVEFALNAHDDAIYSLSPFAKALQNPECCLTSLSLENFAWEISSVAELSSAVASNKTLKHFGIRLGRNGVQFDVIQEFWSNIFVQNDILKSAYDRSGFYKDHPFHEAVIVNALENNISLTTVEPRDYEIDEFTKRNKLHFSKKGISQVVCDVSIALPLPAYVILEIIDWFPLYRKIPHKSKIDGIFGVKNSIVKIKDEFQNKKIKE